MRRSASIGVTLFLLGGIAVAAEAGDSAGSRNAAPENSAGFAPKKSPSKKTPTSDSPSGNSASGKSPSDDSSSSKNPKASCRTPNAPYLDYKCLDPYLGAGFFERLINYYRLEWGHSKAPEDPDAPDARRMGWPDPKLRTPPYPFTEWPYGGTTPIGISRPNQVDSPLMAALANTGFGQMLKADNTQIYGWVAMGGNLSSNSVKPGGNWPAGYYYTPNRDQLDQAVIIAERVPDTVQKDHVDWGYRILALYGENYRYTTAFGFASDQLHERDQFNGYDFPMLYGEVYMPQFAEGLVVRFGRWTGIPDIESQLSPLNYLYGHSLSYIFDQFTNTGAIASLAINRNWILQFGVTVGSDTMPWNLGARVSNPFPNPVFGSSMPRDPGARPSWTAAARWQSDTGRDAVYVVANGINNGTWGYDNLQWTGLTWYHKFAPDWHLAWETYHVEQKNVLNITDPAGIIANHGYPFTPENGFNFNAPFFARCGNPRAVTCTARAVGVVAYLSHQLSPLDNVTLRTEFYDDMQGQRTGTKTSYLDFALGLQHWLSPQVEIRPELAYYLALNANAFNGNANAKPDPIPPNRRDALIVAADLIWHF